MSKERKPKGRAKRGPHIRLVVDMKHPELLAALDVLTQAVRLLTETAARLEQRLERATERFAAMRRG